MTLPLALSPAALLRPFPYAVLFRTQEKRIEVIAICHGHRDPKGW